MAFIHLMQETAQIGSAIGNENMLDRKAYVYQMSWAFMSIYSRFVEFEV